MSEMNDLERRCVDEVHEALAARNIGISQNAATEVARAVLAEAGVAELVKALQAQQRATDYAGDLAALSQDGTRLTEQHMQRGRDLINEARSLRAIALAKVQP